VLKTNLNVKNRPCRIFEIADSFVPAGRKDALPTEKANLAFVCDSEFRDLRGVIEGLVRSIDRNISIIFNPTNVKWAEVGAEILVNEQVIGSAGIFSQAVMDKFDFKDVAPCGAELDFEQLASLQKGPISVRPIPRFPAIERDLSIVVNETVRWADIAEAVNSKALGKLENIQFVGIYRGKSIPSGKKSVTLSLRFRDEDGTLTHETVGSFQAKIVASLSISIGAELRTV